MNNWPTNDILPSKSDSPIRTILLKRISDLLKIEQIPNPDKNTEIK
jgi:hypothetical protein